MLRALNEMTMLQPAAILCDSKYIVDVCKGQAHKWQRNEWRTAAGPVKHTDLWKQILILLDVYGTHVSIYHVPSHSGLTENDTVDPLAGQGRMQSPLWRVNALLLDTVVREQGDSPHVQILGTRDRTPPPVTR